MELKKYNNSTFNKQLLTRVELIEEEYECMSVKLFNHNEELVTIGLNLSKDETINVSADYLLCDVQDTIGLELKK